MDRWCAQEVQSELHVIYRLLKHVGLTWKKLTENDSHEDRPQLKIWRSGVSSYLKGGGGSTDVDDAPALGCS